MVLGTIEMLKAIDLFAGAGGLSTGLEMAGFEILYANEVSDVFSKSLQINHPKTEIATADIRSLDPYKICKSLELKPNELDLLAGGPPCQGFSVNAPSRSPEDERNHLFLDYLRFVEQFKPKVVLIENVPGMVSFEKGNTVKAIISSLEQLGYQVMVRILYAPHYGVPQMRWRTIFIANNLGIDPINFFPDPKYSVKGRPNFATSLEKNSLLIEDNFFKNANSGFVTVRDAIGDLPAIDNRGGYEEIEYISNVQSSYVSQLRGNNETKLHNHICSGLGKNNLERLAHIPQGGSWRDIPYELLPSGMKKARRSDHTQRYGRLEWEGLGSTILTKCDPHWGRFIHPTQNRVISVREAARIQSFPDNCRFLGNIAEQYKQVGNAVPPLFAREIGLAIKSALKNQHSSLTRFDSNLVRQKQFAF